MNLEELASTLGLKKRAIYRGDKQLYLTRYYIFRRTKKWLPSIYLHCFHASDEDMELHNHPWQHSVSLILKGRYREEYRDKFNKVQERFLGPGRLNFIPANKFHRVDLMTSTVWTLFISGRRVQRWGFWDRITGAYRDWEDHLRDKQQKRQQHPRELLKDYPLSLAEILGQE